MEGNLLKRIQLLAGRNVRIFRNNTGTGWQGKPIWKGKELTLQNARPLNAGLCIGSSDLIGWKTVVVTPEMVGKKVAIFTALEGKTGKTSTSKEQSLFLKAVQKAGGIAAIIRTEQDAYNVLNAPNLFPDGNDQDPVLNAPIILADGED